MSSIVRCRNGLMAGVVADSGRLDIADPDRCLRIFKSNRDAGLILFAGMLAAALARA
jgi:hypothetical protein